MMITIGVDLASQPKNTASCLIRWEGGRAYVEAIVENVTDADLCEQFARADKIGIDAPFGWPSSFVGAVSEYMRSLTWPAVGLSELRFRRTDAFIRARIGRWPLSVSSDLIAVPAIRAVRLLAQMAAGGEAIDRSGGGRFVETYPAAALSVWGFRSTGYKRGKGAAARSELVVELIRRTASWLVLEEEARNRCEASDDALDAVVAALVARAAATGRCEPIPPKDVGLAMQEGWIALPKIGSLDSLA